jgi:hypothetical protein
MTLLGKLFEDRIADVPIVASSWCGRAVIGVIMVRGLHIIGDRKIMEEAIRLETA